MTLKTMPRGSDRRQDLDWVVAVDRTIVRAHRHAAGQAPGRSRGGLSSKIHLACGGGARIAGDLGIIDQFLWKIVS